MPPSPPPTASANDAPTSPRVSVVIPALNEESNIPLVLEGLPHVDEVIIVDGGSADDTIAVAREVRPDAVVVRQTRSGKGNALACGFQACTGDIVITLNADGTTDPGEIPRYVDALLAGAEVAHGSRYRDGGGNLDEQRLDRLGNRALNRMVNVLFGTRFTDLGYGYNAYWRTLLPVLDLPDTQIPGQRRGARVWGDGPEIEPLINIRMAAQGLRVVEVASVGYPRIHGDDDRHRVHECVRALRTTLTEYLRRWKIGRQTDRDAQNERGDHTRGSRPQPASGVGRGARRQDRTSGGRTIGGVTVGEDRPVGRGRSSARATADDAESFGSFLPPDDAPSGRHAAHRAGATPSYEQEARDQGARHVADRYAALSPSDADSDDEDRGRHGGGRRHRQAQEPDDRPGGWTYAPNPRQEPPWSRAGSPTIDQRTWRDNYADPDAVVPGQRTEARHTGTRSDPLQRDDPRQQSDRRGAAERRTPAQRRSDQRWHTPTGSGAGSPPATWHLPAPYETTAQRPDLTVIAGEGRTWQAADPGTHAARSAHLRAVPGERYGRAGHRD
jgi:hypothetical protein